MQLEEVQYGCPLVHVVGANGRGRLLALAVEGLQQVSSPGAEEICPDNLDLGGQQVVVVHHGSLVSVYQIQYSLAGLDG